MKAVTIHTNDVYTNSSSSDQEADFKLFHLTSEKWWNYIKSQGITKINVILFGTMNIHQEEKTNHPPFQRFFNLGQHSGFTDIPGTMSVAWQKIIKKALDNPQNSCQPFSARWILQLNVVSLKTVQSEICGLKWCYYGFFYRSFYNCCWRCNEDVIPLYFLAS